MPEVTEGPRRLPRAAMIATAALLAAAGPARAADPVRGGEFFALCVACHSLQEGEHGVGPSLRGVIGRTAGTQPEFRYSPAMRRSGVVWSVETVDRFMADPQALVRGNRMPFDGIGDPTIRADLAAFLAGEATVPVAENEPAR